MIFGSVILSRAQEYEAMLTPFIKPPAGFPITGAFGFADFTLSGTNFTISSGSYENLSGGAASIAYQLATFSGIEIKIIPSPKLDTPGATNGTFSGTAGLNASQINALNDGLLYIAITSSVNRYLPLDEIRGEIMVVPEPATMTVLGAGALALWLRCLIIGSSTATSEWPRLTLFIKKQ